MKQVDLEKHVSKIVAQGYTILENVIEPDLVDQLNQALLELEEKLSITPGGNSFEGDHTIRIYNLLAHQTIFQQVPVNPELLPIVELVLDQGCLVSSLSSTSIDPGEIARHTHWA